MSPKLAAGLVFSLASFLVGNDAVGQETLQLSFTTERWNQQGHLCFYDQDLGNGLDQQNRNVVVIWLEDATTGDFVRTLHRWGRTYVYNLEDWAVSSGYAADTITQASERCYSGETCGSGSNRVTAPARMDTGAIDISDLPDGTYRLRMEISSCEVSDEYRGGGATYEAPDTTLTFTKGRTDQIDVQLGNAFPFGTIALDYRVPSGNSAPGVWAGVDQSIIPSGMNAVASLSASVTDDSGTPSLQWSVVDVEPAGGSATFTTPTAATTNVNFNTSGIYTLRLTATDNQGAASTDDITVNVNVQVISANADAEVHSASGNRTYGVLIANPPASYTAGTWVYMWGPNNAAPCNANNQNRSRGYFRFDLSSVSGTIDMAVMRLPLASQRRETAKWHDFYLLADADDDWVGNSPDDEATITWNNQPVAGGDEANLTGQLVGSYQHRLDYNTWAEVPIDLAVAATVDFNDTWTIFGAPRQRCNGMGVAARENATEPELVIVEHWQAGNNAPPVANAGPDQMLVDSSGNGSATAVLDGSNSTDDIAIVTYTWSENGQTLATTPSATLDLALGIHTIDLTVTDGAQASSTDSIVVTVDDRYTPNSNQSDAEPIDGDPAGKLYGALFVHSEGPNGGDWFSLDLQSDGDVTITANASTGSLDVTLYQADGTTVVDTNSGTGAVSVSQTALVAKAYYLHVEATGGAANAAAYDLNVSVGGDVLSVVLNPSSASEAVGNLTDIGTVTIPQAASNDVVVMLTSSAPERVTVPSPTVTITAGQTSARFDLSVVDNTIEDGNLSVTVRASASGYNAGSAPLLIVDNDGPGPSVSWAESSMTMSEASSPLAIVKAKLSQIAPRDVVVPYTVSGDAIGGTDFDAAPLAAGTLTISAGTTEVSLFFSLFDDDEPEASETVTLTLGIPTGATAGSPSVFTLTIQDDDAMTVDPTPDPKQPVEDVVGGCACANAAETHGDGWWLAMPLLLLVIRRGRSRDHTHNS